jgi:hypothetical protein
MEMLNLLCVSEEIKSTGSNRKVATEKLATNKRLKKKNETWNTPQIKTIQKTLELRLISPQTQHKEPEHTHLKFVTLRTPSVDKITKLHGFKHVI